MNNQNIVKKYRPGQNSGWGYQVWHEMFSELADSHELVWRLFLRNFKAKYRHETFNFPSKPITPKY
jgi:hypothetical protein